jgi:hypothetical protein
MKIDTSGNKVRNFGFLFGFIAAAIAVYIFYKGGNSWPWFVGGAALFLLTGMFLRPILRPVYVLWMKFAFLLAWVNTRLLLGIFFYGIITPTGLVMRALGKDPLTRRIDRTRTSYWIKRDKVAFDPKRYEHLF